MRRIAVVLVCAPTNGVLIVACGSGSPPGNIDCSISVGTSSHPRPEGVFWTTFTPPRSVTTDSNGSLQECTGPQCEANGRPGTPTPAHGSGTGAGPLVGVSELRGMRCTVTGSRGFSLSAAGIVPVVR